MTEPMKPVLDILILAHGQQTRLPQLGVLPKCLIQLAECGETILERTIRMVHEIVGKDGNFDPWVTVVAAPFVAKALLPHPWRVIDWKAPELPCKFVRLTRGMPNRTSLYARSIEVLSFHETPATAPKCTLERLEQVFRFQARATGNAVRHVLLLGDVVWSRDALQRVLLDMRRPVTFAGTPDLSTSGGELFAITWATDRNEEILENLQNCERSAHRDVPQPGQLRRLLWYRRGNKDSPLGDPQYMIISDWTRDVDTSADLDRLPTLDALAAAEERAYLSSLLPAHNPVAGN